MTDGIRPIWTVLAWVLPLVAAVPVLKVWLSPSNGTFGAAFALGVVIFIFGGSAGILGAVSAVIGLVRGEPWALLAWLALVLNLVFLTWLYMRF